MAVPLNNVKYSKIKDEVIGTGGSVSSTNYDITDLANAANYSLFDPIYLDGATNKSQIRKIGQFRNYPRTIYYNITRSQNFTKLCSGGTGSIVTYTISAGTYQSFVSQTDADNQAIADISANGQNYANTNGSCTWYNSEISQNFTRDCPGGSGSTVTYTVPYAKYSSNINQADADSKATSDMSSNGQVFANNNGSCIFYNDLISGNYTRNNCGDGGTGSVVTYTVSAGVYSSSISKGDANQKAYDELGANGQNHANSVGTCTWCSDARDHWIQRNNCSSGYTGSWFNVPASACKFSSNVSKADAETQLNNWFNGSEAQGIANDNGTCECSGTWEWDSTYCSGYDLYKIERKYCGGYPTNETRHVLVTSGSCTCTNWLNIGGTYCSSNNLVQDQSRYCENVLHSRTQTVETNSSSCIVVDNFYTNNYTGCSNVNDGNIFFHSQGFNFSGIGILTTARHEFRYGPSGSWHTSQSDITPNQSYGVGGFYSVECGIYLLDKSPMTIESRIVENSNNAILKTWSHTFYYPSVNTSCCF